MGSYDSEVLYYGQCDRQKQVSEGGKVSNNKTVHFGTDLIPLYDNCFPLHEQFPREVIFEFTQKDFVHVSTFIAGEKKPYGSILTDNAYFDDGYRFHDIFHIANMTILGWSPAVRALLKCKRKSVPCVDEVEDGARAIFCEEGLVCHIFAHARKNNDFLHENLSEEFIKDSILAVSHLEVNSMPLDFWRMTVVKGFEVWHECHKNSGGYVYANLLTKDLVYSQYFPADV